MSKEDFSYLANDLLSLFLMALMTSNIFYARSNDHGFGFARFFLAFFLLVFQYCDLESYSFKKKWLRTELLLLTNDDDDERSQSYLQQHSS